MYKCGTYLKLYATLLASHFFRYLYLWRSEPLMRTIFYDSAHAPSLLSYVANNENT